MPRIRRNPRSPREIMNFQALKDALIQDTGVEEKVPEFLLVSLELLLSATATYYRLKSTSVT